MNFLLLFAFTADLYLFGFRKTQNVMHDCNIFFYLAKKEKLDKIIFTPDEGASNGHFYENSKSITYCNIAYNGESKKLIIIGKYDIRVLNWHIKYNR